MFRWWSILSSPFASLFLGGNAIKEIVKEKLEPEIDANLIQNKELYYEDVVKGIPNKQMIKNIQCGKYKNYSVYPEPHRDKDGKIIIENEDLYYSDLIEHGAVQTQKWVQQGKYNLTPEELKEQMKRREERYKKRF